MLHSEPRGSLYAEAFTAIEADLEAFDHGQEAGHNVLGRAVIYHIAKLRVKLRKKVWHLFCYANTGVAPYSR